MLAYVIFCGNVSGLKCHTYHCLWCVLRYCEVILALSYFYRRRNIDDSVVCASVCEPHSVQSKDVRYLGILEVPCRFFDAYVSSMQGLIWEMAEVDLVI